VQATFADCVSGSGMKLDGAIIRVKGLFIVTQFRPAISYGMGRFVGRRLKFLRDLIPGQGAIGASQDIKDHAEKDGYAIGDSSEFESPHFLFQRLLELTLLVVNPGEGAMSVRRVGCKFQGG